MPETIRDPRIDQLERLLFEEDPIGINFGTNPDEYRPEAKSIAARMPTATSLEQTLTIVYAEFAFWFGAGGIGPRERYARIAEHTWGLWRED